VWWAWMTNFPFPKMNMCINYTHIFKHLTFKWQNQKEREIKKQRFDALVVAQREAEEAQYAKKNQ
jgi:hypothetical protein